jgi:predicted  nucleic acid-binding Zn-ribbon protein
MAREELEKEIVTIHEVLASSEADAKAQREAASAAAASRERDLNERIDALAAQVSELEAQLSSRADEVDALTSQLALSASDREGTHAELQGQLARVESELLASQKEVKRARKVCRWLAPNPAVCIHPSRWFGWASTVSLAHTAAFCLQRC